MFDKLIILQKALVFHYQLYKTRKHLWLNLAQLKNLQEHKLKALLKHAYDKVSYYRRLFDQIGIKPEDIKTIDDLQKIPITSRKTLQALPVEEVVTKGVNIAQCGNLRTSGSTGRPLDIFISGISGQDKSRRLSDLRMWFDSGRRLKDKVLVITTPHNFLQKQWFHPWLYRLKILREKYVPLCEETDYFVSEIVHYKPDIILSYPSIIKALALQIKGRKIRGINPRMIFSTGEMLSNKDREFISSVFKAEVFDYYACNECGLIAWECKEQKGYHIDSDNVIVELVKNGSSVSAGEEGEVVITALNSYTMPFIRYKLGDIAMLADHKCACRRGFSLLEIISGRVNDCIILPNGKILSPYVLMATMDRIKEVLAYQIIQEDKCNVKINIFQKEQLHMAVMEKIKKAYKEIFGNNIQIKVNECVDSEKRRIKNKIIISKIKDNFEHAV